MKNEIKEFLDNNWVVAILAPLVLMLICFISRSIYNFRKQNKVYLWLRKNTENRAHRQFKSTAEITKGLDIDEDQGERNSGVYMAVCQKVYMRKEAYLKLGSNGKFE